ncbi:MAG TPA: hypothetical protein VM554_12730 [Acidisarcina sp.]|nr:hypothetical protein [Acidisarcina sp.]
MNWKKIGAVAGAAILGFELTGAQMFVLAQTAVPVPQQGAPTAQPKPDQASPAQTKPDSRQPPHDRKISPQQAKELFRSVDEILRFSSEDSKLPIRSKVKRRLTTREAVEQYILEKLKNDEDAKRMQRGEIVLKKFGLIDRDFQLGPFLVSLLKEQVAGYYDDKTKTVNLLDWIEPEEQKSVLAHELTHALQDQRVNLEKWQSKTQTGLSHTVAEDNQHLAVDETDTARDAVLEGQAMAVFLDWQLKPTGKTLLTAGREVEDRMDQMDDAADSPVLARAPLLLQQELLFPYRDGLKFETAMLQDRGVEAAFAGVLDHPPSTSYEVMNPHAYEAAQKIPLLRMPDIHGLVDADYDPYDVGVMGQLDVRILTELFGGPAVSRALTPAWDGGLYYAAQRKSAHTPEEKASTKSLSTLYFSNWKTEEAAQAFATMYAKELGVKYSGVSLDSESDTPHGEQIYHTSEGPALIVVTGRQVFISESFDLALARKLELLLTGAQQGEQLRMADASSLRREDLTSFLRRFLGGCGMMRAGLMH